MKKIFYVLVALSISHLSFNIASAQSWQWGKRAGSNFDESGPGGGNYENTIDMATDYNGNTYSLCRVYGKSTVGPTVVLDSDGDILPTYGASDILLTSFNCKGEYRWSKTIGNSNTGDGGIALRTDEWGGVYVLGKYVAYNYGSPLKPLNVDDDTVLNTDNRGIFLVKYDTSGNYQWIRTPEPDTMGYVFARTPAVFSSLPIEMGIDRENDICILTYLRPGAFANGAYVVSNPGMTYHMLVYDRFGVFKKGYKMDMSSYTGNSNNAPNSIRMSFDQKTNKWYIGGYLSKGFPGFDDTLVIGGKSISGSGYLARFDNNGKLDWLKENSLIGTSSNYFSISARPLIDKYSNVYISGSALPNNAFNGYKFTNTTGASQSVNYVLKLYSSGKTAWIKTSDSTTAAAILGCGLSLQGNTIGFYNIFVGRLKWDSHRLVWPVGATYIPLLVRLNSITGQVFGADTLATKVSSISNGRGVLTVDRFSNFYLGGGFLSDNTMKVGLNTLVSAGGKTDIYLAKHGRNNCDCSVAPTAAYTVSTPTGSLSSSFTFGGTSPADSVVWYFGDSTEARGTTATHTFKAKGTYNVCVVVYNRCGSDVNCKDVTVGTTGVHESLIANVKIYPNPANDFLYIDGLQSSTELSLSNIVGQEVKRLSSQKNKEQISIGNLPSGIYLLQLKTATGEVYTTKVVKE